MDITTVNETFEKKINIEWLMSDTVDNICRACLSVSDMLINLHSENHAIRFISCTQLQMDKQDGLPPCLCQSCFNILGHFYNFKQLCCQSDGALRQHLFRNQERIKIEIPEFDNQEHKDTTSQNDMLPDNDDESFSSKASKDLHHDDLELLKQQSSVLPSKKKLLSKCTICPKTFKSSRGLKNHLIFHTEANPISDNQTPTVLKNEDTDVQTLPAAVLQTEVVQNNIIKDYSCEICLMRFCLKRELTKHMRTHPDDESYACTICGKAVKKLSMPAHKRTHSDLRPFKCDICNRTFRESKTLADHRRTHTGEKPHECRLCGHAFIQKTALNQHMKCHNKDKNSEIQNEGVSCNICDKKLKSALTLKRHMILHTGVKNYKCTTCNRSFTHSISLKHHESLHTGIQKYVCHICGKKFRQKECLMIHVRNHAGIKPYSCNQCGNKFARKSDLQSHIMRHGPRNISCSHCPLKFYLKQDKDKHERRHFEKKLYSCEICGKSYKTRSFMAEHKRVHTGDRPYQCDICSQSFRSTGALRSHKMIHTGERPYRCRICDRGFIQKTPYNRHMKSHIKMNSNEHVINSELNSDVTQDKNGNIDVLSIIRKPLPRLLEFQSITNINNKDTDTENTYKIEKRDTDELMDIS